MMVDSSKYYLDKNATYHDFCQKYYPNVNIPGFDGILFLDDYSDYLLLFSGTCCCLLGVLLMFHPRLNNFPNFLYGMTSFLEG